MARLKEPGEPRDCAYLLCGKEFTPKFTGPKDKGGQIYCSEICRRRANYTTYQIKRIPTILKSLTDEELTKLLDSAGVRDLYGHKRFCIPKKMISLS
jgi:hypothetical protein